MNMSLPRSLRPRRLAPLAACLALGLSACGGGGGPSTGTANLSLTDAPICSDLESVVVTVRAIELVGDSGTFTLTLPTPQMIDLTSLVNGTTLPLGSITVPAGTYQQLRLLLVSNTGNSQPYANYVVPSGTTNKQPLTTPSAQQSGYKINGQFTVTANGQVNLTVDFNACRSVVLAGNSGQYILKPVLNLTDDDESGSIAGDLPAADAGAVVMAEDDLGHILKTTVAAAGSSGSAPSTFSLDPLPASSTGYNVVIAPPAPTTNVTPSPNFAPDVILGVPVSAGLVTALGSTASPLPVIATTTDAFFSGTLTLPTASDALVVAQEPVGSTTTISIAESNGVETSSSTTQDYAMELPTAAPNVAPYSASGLVFAQSGTTPTITIMAYDSDGASGSDVPGGSGGSITLTGSSDDTYDADH